ncbi:TonB-dependent receptor [Roseateles koreensis]|uniref:TonB-dependent siderophore receptor n=1 Tax=Roseateles koreensis TaxID=2987526 RepID=A0ABT5KQ09_9BURK|nr:TonB-dependent siderophore receptor [Roseateles koreensis]MDC8784993.1 TonB-dependent siderophore receptor [Roseateles koreensis]
MSSRFPETAACALPASSTLAKPGLTCAPALLPLGAFAAGFGLMVGSAFAQSTVPVPPALAASTAPGEVVLPAVRVKAAAADDTKQNLQTTTTTIGKGQQDIRDIPQSITVMTEKLLDDAKLDTLKQALHYTAGITFAATENGTDQDIRMRGFPVATTGDLLIDGMKDPSQYDRDSFNYDRIEVMRGSASMLFGRGSTGGVINQVTKKPELLDQSDVVTTVGTGGYVRATGDFNVRLGESAALRVNAMNTTADNNGAKVNKHGVAPSFSWGIDSADEFNVGLFYLKVDNVPMSNLRYLSGSVAAQIPAQNFYGTASDFLKGEALYGSASWTHRFADGGTLRTQFRKGDYKRNSWSTTASYPTGSTAASVTDSTLLSTVGLAPRKDDIDGTYLQSDYSNRFEWFGLRNEVITGVDAAYEKATRFGAYGSVLTNYNKGSVSVGDPNNGRVTAALPTYRQTSDFTGTSVGAYMQDLVSLTEHWKLLGGLRYDRFKADMHSNVYANNTTATTPTSVTPSNLSYPELWSYRGGVLYQPSLSQSYHFSYGTSFNTSADTYQYTTQQIANVPAEQSRNVELGAKLDWLNGQLSTRAALFRTEKYNERTTDSDFAGTYPVLSGKRHSQGLEFDITGRITPALEVYVSYSFIQEAKIDKAGSAVTLLTHDVGLTPKHSGAAWLSYQLAPKLRIAGGARGASENRPLQGGTAAASVTARAPGYVAYDAMVEFKPTEDFFAQLNVNNLTDKVYGDQLYPGFYTPGEARTLRMTLGVRF